MPLRFVVLLVATLASSAARAEQPKIAVMPLRSTTLDAKVTKGLDSLLVTAVSGLGKYSVISPADVSAALGFEKMKDAVGCDDVSCAAEIAGALGARYLLSATINGFGNALVLTSTLLDNDKAEVIGREKTKVQNSPDYYYNAIEELVAKTFGVEVEQKLGADAATVKSAGAKCLADKDQDACKVFLAGGKDPIKAGVEACKGGDEAVCEAMAKSDSERSGLALIDSCNSGTYLACKWLAQTGRAELAGETLRHVGIAFFIVGAVGAAFLLVTPIAVFVVEEKNAELARLPYGSAAWEAAGDSKQTWDLVRFFSTVVGGSIAGLGAAIGIPTYIIGSGRESEILEKAEAPSIAFAPTVLPTPNGGTAPGFGFAFSF